MTLLIFGVVAVLCTLLAPANYWWLLGVIPLVVWVFMLNWRRGILLEKMYGLLVPELLRSAVRRLPDERAKNINGRYYIEAEFPAVYAVDFFKENGGWLVKRYIACVETRLTYTEQYGKVVQAMMGMLPDKPREETNSGMAAQSALRQHKTNVMARNLVGGLSPQQQQQQQYAEYLKTILANYDIDQTK